MTKRMVLGLKTVTGSDATPAAGDGVVFRLNDVTQFTEFTNLFDEYKITGVAYRWVITRDPSNASTAANAGRYPRVIWTHDHDSAQLPSAATDILQYAKSNEIWFTDNRQCSKWYYIKPAMAMLLYNGVTSGYGSKWGQWIDCNSPSLEHYGLRFWYDSLFTGVNLQLECKYYMRFKTVI